MTELVEYPVPTATLERQAYRVAGGVLKELKQIRREFRDQDAPSPQIHAKRAGRHLNVINRLQERIQELADDAEYALVPDVLTVLQNHALVLSEVSAAITPILATVDQTIADLVKERIIAEGRSVDMDEIRAETELDSTTRQSIRQALNQAIP